MGYKETITSPKWGSYGSALFISVRGAEKRATRGTRERSIVTLAISQKERGASVNLVERLTIWITSLALSAKSVRMI